MEEYQWNRGVSKCTKQTGKIIVQRSSKNTRKDHKQISFHAIPDLVRHTQKMQDGVDPYVNQNIQKQCDSHDQHKGMYDRAFQRILVIFPL